MCVRQGWKIGEGERSSTPGARAEKLTGRTFRKSLGVKWCDEEVSNYIFFMKFKEVLLSQLKEAKKMMCCARGSMLTGCSPSGEVWDLKETGREAALSHRHYFTFSLPRGSTLYLGTGGLAAV